MRIGIDVDGVLTDLEQYLWDYGSKYLNELNQDISIDHTQYNTLATFGWSIEKDDMFWHGTYDNYSKNVEIRKFASEVIKKLKKEGHEIYIITARGHDSWVLNRNKSDKMLKKWLRINKVKYDKLIFTEANKLEHCLKNNIDIMIDDCPYNIRQISKKVPMICMHANYNARMRGKNIVRCHSWYEIYDRISSLTILN